MTPSAFVFPFLPRNETVALVTGSPASVTVNLIVTPEVWLNFAGFAVSFRPGRICVCQISSGFPDAADVMFANTSTRPDDPSAERRLNSAQSDGGFTLRTGPNPPPVVLVRTASILDFALSHHRTQS